jgi:hypothetical protein
MLALVRLLYVSLLQLAGQVLPPTATDTFEYTALDTLWADVKSESVTHYQRSAAFRTLAALSRSSLSRWAMQLQQLCLCTEQHVACHICYVITCCATALLT